MRRRFYYKAQPILVTDIGTALLVSVAWINRGKWIYKKLESSQYFKTYDIFEWSVSDDIDMLLQNTQWRQV